MLGPVTKIAPLTWVSGHVYFKGSIHSTECDKLVLDVVAPFVDACVQRGWITQYFFIRYGDPRPHVRLRLHKSSDLLTTVLEEGLSDVAKELSKVDREGLKPDALDPGVGQNPAGCELRFVPYEPEIERYGGRQGILIAEELFHSSSETTIALIRRFFPMDRPSRLAKGLMAMVLAGGIFLVDRRRVAEFFGQYGSNYLRQLVKGEEDRTSWFEAFELGHKKQEDSLGMYVDEIWQRVEAEVPLSDEFVGYQTGLESARGRLSDLLDRRQLVSFGIPIDDAELGVRMMMSSYIHMMNNRLGITTYEESYLSHLIGVSLA